MDAMCDQLLQDAIARGTIARVAEELGVEPRQLYRWLGGLQPAERERAHVMARLRQLQAFEAYFARRSKAVGSAWQQ